MLTTYIKNVSKNKKNRMTQAIIITIASILGLIFSMTNKGFFQKFITVGLSISIFIILFGDSNTSLIGILLQLVLAFVSLIYSLTVKGQSIAQRITIGLTGPILTIGTLIKIHHYYGQNELRLALIFPIVFFIWLMIKNKLKQPKEFGFMLIWITLSLLELGKEIIN